MRWSWAQFGHNYLDRACSPSSDACEYFFSPLTCRLADGALAFPGLHSGHNDP